MAFNELQGDTGHCMVDGYPYYLAYMYDGKWIVDTYSDEKEVYYKSPYVYLPSPANNYKGGKLVKAYERDVSWPTDIPHNTHTNDKKAYDLFLKHGNNKNKIFFDDVTCGTPSPKPPTPEEGESEQTDKSSCNNTGQFGGDGTPLKDIKLFLYTNNVTKGTIKLSKPQVEVGTFATDWRPNPSDYIKANSPAYKEVKGLAIQHNQSQNKKYLEIATVDGYAYGVDLWGGDAKKILEQQQAEIEELKKLVQTLETKINV